jgi:hypothetical protein
MRLARCQEASNDRSAQLFGALCRSGTITRSDDQKPSDTGFRRYEKLGRAGSLALEPLPVERRFDLRSGIAE